MRRRRFSVNGTAVVLGTSVVYTLVAIGALRYFAYARRAEDGPLEITLDGVGVLFIGSLVAMFGSWIVLGCLYSLDESFKKPARGWLWPVLAVAMPYCIRMSVPELK